MHAGIGMQCKLATFIAANEREREREPMPWWRRHTALVAVRELISRISCKQQVNRQVDTACSRHPFTPLG